MDSLSYTELRERMVAEQIEARGIRDPRLLAALRRVPRHLFVAPRYRRLAYDDNPLPTRFHQTISQPYIVALMTELLRLTGQEKVLEIGSGSGYQAGVLSLLAREVHTLENLPALAEQAAERLAGLDLANIHIYTRDGSAGLPEMAPFDRILVTAAAPRPPTPLLDQLGPLGLMVIPVGPRNGQTLQVWQKEGAGFLVEDIAPVAFVPLRGEFGWSTTDWREDLH